MIPPLVRRCPDCGHLGFGPRFSAVETEEGRRLECPACSARFEPVDRPLLN
ncbi:hypothetical protein [Halalkalicoccus tibetensis]|uniref:hypothetical protein n=1 Tax=Halalkalicoccus tibetensis TaxID=175632 RepID=UPI0030F46C65